MAEKKRRRSQSATYSSRPRAAKTASLAARFRCHKRSSRQSRVSRRAKSKAFTRSENQDLSHLPVAIRNTVFQPRWGKKKRRSTSKSSSSMAATFGRSSDNCASASVNRSTKWPAARSSKSTSTSLTSTFQPTKSPSHNRRRVCTNARRRDPLPAKGGSCTARARGERRKTRIARMRATRAMSCAANVLASC
jgi:hypothetical protein